ncbi:hypothetical protein B296_00011295 [Ensete ventricosum]|uniref:Uncharacterized protein n=1 Tax=Ensete ventricosum TaxID=4639 RepID=A0A427A8W2_ENSVE|nr:hypothetical protein B296_00011295 [Ensete ventricosum]
MLLYVAVGMKAATTTAAAREKGKSSMAVVLFFFFFFLLWLQRRYVPFLFKMLVARREGTVAVRSGEVEGSGGQRLRAEGSDRRSRLCVDGQWGGIGCGCVATTRATSSGGGLRGYAKEEQRVMATGVVAGYSGMGEKEAKEATTMTEVVGKRRQQPMMGGSGSRRPELAVAAVKKADGWLWLRVDYGSGT